MTIPTAIGSLSALTSLALTWCSLIGNLPPALFTLPSLQSLDLTYNALNGTLPAALNNLNQLSSLSLTSNNLTGPFPLSLGAMKSLSIIELSGNFFVGSVPSQAVPWALAATQGYLNVEDNCQLAASSLGDVGTQARCLKSKSVSSTPLFDDKSTQYISQTLSYTIPPVLSILLLGLRAPTPAPSPRSAPAIQSDGATLCSLIQSNNRYLGGCFGWNGYKPGYTNNQTNFVRACPTFKAGVLPIWCGWTGGWHTYLLNTHPPNSPYQYAFSIYPHYTPSKNKFSTPFLTHTHPPFLVMTQESNVTPPPFASTAST